MVERNWLIRTRNKKLLGPVSKKKIRELLDKGSLNGDDELSTGNGYWFWVRERELIDKYVFGDIPQEFNPVSEADNSDFSFISDKSQNPKIARQAPQVGTDSENFVYPEDDDLAYPDISAPNPSNNQETGDILPSSEDLEYPDMGSTESETFEEDEPPPAPVNFEHDSEESEYDLDESESIDEDLDYPDIDNEDYPEDHSSTGYEHEEFDDIDDVDSHLESRNNETTKKSSKKTKKEYSEYEDTDTEKHVLSKEKKQRNDRYLFFIILILIFLIGFVLYLYHNLFSSPFPLIGINSAQAQTISAPQSLSKKKVFLN